MPGSPLRAIEHPDRGPRTIRFGPFTLDTRAHELRKHSTRLKVRRQTVQVLLLLLENPGEVVLREEIRRRLWPDDTVVEFDHSINAAVQKLREALSDSAEKPRYIETLKGRGYRFIGIVELVEARPVTEQPCADRPLPVEIPLLHSHQPSTENTKLVSRARVWVASAIAIVLVIIGSLILIGRRSQPPPRNWTLPIGPIELPVVSPDGSSVVYRKSGGITLRRLDSIAEVPLSGAKRPIDPPAWSPDGSEIVFATVGEICKMQVPAGPVVTLCRLSSPIRGISWGADGNILVAVNEGGGGNLASVHSSGGELRRIIVPGLDDGVFYQPLLLPDKEHMLFGWAAPGDEEIGIYFARLHDEVSLDSPVLLRKNVTAAKFAELHDETFLLFVQNDTIYAQKLDFRTGKPSSSVRRLIDSVFSVPGMARAHFSVSSTGVLAWRSGRAVASQATWFDRSGKPIQTAGPLMDLASVALSPDERHVFVETSRRQMFVMDPSGKGLTPMPGVFRAHWMGDGRRFVYQGRRLGNATPIFERTGEGGAPTQLLVWPGTARLKHVLADGTTALFTTEQWALNSTRIDGNVSEPVRIPLVKGNVMTAHVSPDGRWLLYSETLPTSGTARVFVQRFPSAVFRTQISSEFGQHPVWRADGKEIVYRDGTKLFSVRVDVVRDELVAHAPVALFDVNIPLGMTGDSEPLAISRDGSRILFVQGVPDADQQLSYVMTRWDSGTK